MRWLLTQRHPTVVAHTASPPSRPVRRCSGPHSFPVRPSDSSSYCRGIPPSLASLLVVLLGITEVVTVEIFVPLPLSNVRRHVGRSLFLRWGGDGGPTSRIAFKASSGDGARAAAAGPGGRAGPRRKEEWRTSRPATAERLCSAINLQHLDSPIGIREEGVRRGHDAERLRRDRGILSAPQAPVDGVPLPRPLLETADVLRASKRGDVVRVW